ncbi:hypothetical protein DVH24_001027 [Malus domestica]|uniref:Uncharacterized protein n=1 Tax=Malus domestica TaxID=3750 RepID=A0A498K561_MALDO|nr:hypothetical protein DVH24_001027 [Malus domestica]
MTVRLTNAQEREVCVESVMPSPSQTTEDSWRSSRSIENDTIWVSKSDEILLDLWKPVARYEFSYRVTTSGHCKFQFAPEFGGALLARWEKRKMDIPLLVLLHLCLSWNKGNKTQNLRGSSTVSVTGVRPRGSGGAFIII